MLGHTYTKTLFIVHLKLKINCAFNSFLNLETLEVIEILNETAREGDFWVNPWKKWGSQVSISGEEHSEKREEQVPKPWAWSMLGWNMVANMARAGRITLGGEKVTDNRVYEATRLCRPEKAFCLLFWVRWKATEGLCTENWHNISHGLMGLLWLLRSECTTGKQTNQMGGSYNSSSRRWWWLQLEWWQLG